MSKFIDLYNKIIMETGIYGNSIEDRAREKELDSYTDRNYSPSLDFEVTLQEVPVNLTSLPSEEQYIDAGTFTANGNGQSDFQADLGKLATPESIEKGEITIKYSNQNNEWIPVDFVDLSPEDKQIVIDTLIDYLNNPANFENEYADALQKANDDYLVTEQSDDTSIIKNIIETEFIQEGITLIPDWEQYLPQIESSVKNEIKLRNKFEAGATLSSIDYMDLVQMVQIRIQDFNMIESM